MSALSRTFSSSIGRKWIVAITGVGLLGFVFVHISGNLLVFGGPEKINAYSQGLKDLGALLWVARGGLLVFFILHVLVATKLNLENHAARGRQYAKKNYQKASLPSRTMLVSGTTLFLFILYHLAHYTFMVIHNTGPHVDELGRHDVYRMVILGFSNPVISGIYILAMAFLAMHLVHATPSMIQTVGLGGPKAQCFQSWVGKAVAILMFVLYCSIPIAVLAGVLS